jgi:ferritin-like metal-binding protein YciE
MKNLNENGREDQVSSKGHAETMSADMNDSTLHQLFVNELKDIYWAEKHIVKNLPAMIKDATSPELKNALESHFKETENHVTRLENVFDSIGEKAVGKKCEAMAGLVDEAKRTVGSTDKGSLVRDVAIITSCQKIEHYEIASYGTLQALASIMNHTEATNLLNATLSEEKNANKTLNNIAMSHVNEGAKTERN